ncbi:hypothetical protein Vadar_029893 [Vaccinium darrowii]|uniref:Uncharacterized protein n=1 Tax=Vaccinium darrowii TaxID=229202 RepID=A0ACB7Y3K5_9ERIC|nr:hypothetical protein Vadar_029893 [Vaccinium darrowii]
MTKVSRPTADVVDSAIVNIKTSLLGTPIKMAKVERSPKNIWGESPHEFFTILECMNSEIIIFRLTMNRHWCGMVWNGTDDMNLHLITTPKTCCMTKAECHNE